MVKVVKRPRAELDSLDIWDFIAEDSLDRADDFLDFLEEKLANLARNPGMGKRREDISPDLRSFPVKNYIVFYREIEGGIDVIRILHGSRNIEAELRF